MHAVRIHPNSVLRATGGCETIIPARVSAGAQAMGKSDTGFDYDRYRSLLAEADDEQKRLAFINLLVDEKARDKLAAHSLRTGLAGLRLNGNTKAAMPNR
jgi:hypothetical protein